MDNTFPNSIELGEFDLDSFLNNDSPEEVLPIRINNNSNRQIIIAVDASNSMQGYKVGAVNDTVNNIISKLNSIGRSQNGALSVAVIGFSSRLFRWTDGFVPVHDFKFSYVESTDGLTDINALFEELTRLAVEGMNAEAKKIVVLFSDGLPTEDYSVSISKWKQTRFYNDVEKISVSFDDDLLDPQSREFLEEFADHGQVLSIKDKEELLSAILN